MRFNDLIKHPVKKKKLTYMESLQTKLAHEMASKSVRKFTELEIAIMEGGGSLEEADASVADLKARYSDFDRQQTVYTPAEKDPWLKDPAMAKARRLKQRYIDPKGRIWNFDQNDMGFRNYQGLRTPKNIPGVNIKPVDMVGKRVYHCTNKIQSIQKSGGLKPKVDVTGENEYGRLSTHFDPFIPVKGIWVTSEEDTKWTGKHCVSFVIEPSDQVAKAYGVGLVVLNPIPWDRLQVES